MIKRRLGNHVRARSRWGQVRELAPVVLTHNLMILWCSILFYRACQDSFLGPAEEESAPSGSFTAHSGTAIRTPEGS